MRIPPRLLVLLFVLGLVLILWLMRTFFRSKSASEIVVVSTVALLLLSLLGPAILIQREKARRQQAISKLKDVAISLHSYHDTHQTFPANAATRLKPEVAEKRRPADRKPEATEEELISPY